MHLSEHAGKVLHLLNEHQGMLPPTELVASGQFHSKDGPSGLEDATLRRQSNATFYVQAGIEECLTHGLVEFGREPMTSVNFIRLTALGREVLSC